MTYEDRMMKARDPRFQKIAGKLYGRRDMQAETKEPEEDEITVLRREYADKMGKRPGPTWDEATIRAKMAE